MLHIMQEVGAQTKASIEGTSSLCTIVMHLKYESPTCMTIALV